MRVWILAVLIALGARGAGAQIITVMTPEQIAEAIKTGSAPEFNSGGYIWRETSGLTAMIKTPFGRVAMAAEEAKKKYAVFTVKNVTAEMVAPTVTFVAKPYLNQNTKRVVSVDHVVVALWDENDPAKTVQPLSIEKITTVVEGSFERGDGVFATFDIGAIAPGPGKEFRLILSSGREGYFRLTPEVLAKIH